jgi:hypothetical protein
MLRARSTTVDIRFHSGTVKELRRRRIKSKSKKMKKALLPSKLLSSLSKNFKCPRTKANKMSINMAKRSARIVQSGTTTENLAETTTLTIKRETLKMIS